MIEKAIARFNIDISASFFIGDSPSDIEAARQVDLKAFKINTNDSIETIVEQILQQINFLY